MKYLHIIYPVSLYYRLSKVFQMINRILLISSLCLLCLSHTHSSTCSHSHGNLDNLAISQRWPDEDLWFYGILSGFTVSMIGFFAAFLLILFKKFSSQALFASLIQILFAFSCGALLGDVMMHVLPQVYASGEATPFSVGITFISAIIFFLGLERLFQKVGITHSHWHQDSAQHIQENHAVTEKRELQNQKNQQNEKQSKQSIAPHVPHPPEKEATGYLNLISSLLHNFIDGLAIGVAYSTGNPNAFLPITLGIIAHEIPREMGDVAILMHSNFNQKQTIISNGIINCISLVGVLLGLNSNDLSNAVKQHVLVFVAGNFLYIAADIWKNLLRNKSLKMNVLELIGFTIGVGLTMIHTHSH